MGGSLSVTGIERTCDAVLLALHTHFDADEETEIPLSTRARVVFERVDRSRCGWIASARLDGVLAELGLADRWDRREVEAFAQWFVLDEDQDSGDTGPSAPRTSSRLDYLAFLDVVFYPIQVSHNSSRQLKITQQCVVSAGGWLVHDGEYAGRAVAVKEVALGTEASDDNNERDRAVGALRHRVNALRLVAHPNIVRYVATVQTTTSLFVVQHAYPSCTLKTILESFGPMKEATIRRYVVQVLEALRFLHGNDIIHGHVHLESIHIDSSGLLKLSEFGARSEYRCLLPRATGTSSDWLERYPPPEQATSKAADVWAVGVLILQMAHGVGKEAERALADTSKTGAASLPPIPSTMSKSLRSVVQGCLQRRVRGRLTIDRVCDHEFFQVDPARATSEILRDVCSDLDESMQRLTSSRGPRPGTRGSATRHQSSVVPERPLFTAKLR